MGFYSVKLFSSGLGYEPVANFCEHGEWIFIFHKQLVYTGKLATVRLSEWFWNYSTQRKNDVTYRQEQISSTCIALDSALFQIIW